ncbi:flavodoxin family protein [Methanoplanus sp. FWC-SCC4]|uniref:Flavodoxin family protein n=2 Tax=Methanochimaera problematica TaxID=2609417 RepID=A0AA97FE87_9EURY|nr:flavodoxin family protein [Methanoplanus sp. FWC-SCC4]
MKILGISGSPRKRGNTDIILNQILLGANDSGFETEAIFLRDYTINSCIGCEKCRKDLTCSHFKDGMNLIYPKIEEAELLILGSPVYNYNITSRMKSFIDRLYPYYEFSDDRPRKYSSRLTNKKRQALVFSVCEQTDPKEDGFATEALARPLEALGYEIADKLTLFGFFERGAVLKDMETMEKARLSGAKFAENY